MTKIHVAHISRTGVVLLIPSENREGANYTVEHKHIKVSDEMRWTCTCMAYRFQENPKEDCKHIVRAKEFLVEKRDSNDKRIAPLARALMCEEI
jgi:hypothetical protein